MYLVQTISPGTKHIKHKSIIGIIENIVTGVSKKKKKTLVEKEGKKKKKPGYQHFFPSRTDTLKDLLPVGVKCLVKG